MAELQMFNRHMGDQEPEIQALAQWAELGELRKVYHARKSGRTIWIFGLLSLVYGGIWLALSTLIYFTSSSLSVSPLWAGPEVLLLALSLWRLRSEKIYGRWYVSSWNAGLISEKGLEPQVIRWRQIKSIQRKPVALFRLTDSAFNYQIRCKDGSEVTVKSFFRRPMCSCRPSCTRPARANSGLLRPTPGALKPVPSIALTFATSRRH